MAQAFSRICTARGIAHHLLDRTRCDIANREAIREIFHRLRPWAVINAAGYNGIDRAGLDRNRCYRSNTLGPATLATECARRGVRLVTFSSDLVFNGTSSRSYVESDGPDPLSYYGFTKAEAERLVSNELPSALIVRTGSIFGPWDNTNFLTVALQSLAEGDKVLGAADSVSSPTYLPDLVNATLDLLIDGEQGIWHLANDGAVSEADFVALAAPLCGLSNANLYWYSLCDLAQRAPRPRFSVLGSERGWIMPKLEDALLRFAAESELELDSTLRAA